MMLLLSTEDYRCPNVPAKSTLQRYGLDYAGWLQIIQLDVHTMPGGGMSWFCPVCGEFPKGGKSVIDHQHVRGWKTMPPVERRKYVRGVVCITCNHWILTSHGTVGKFLAAADYLKRFGKGLIS